MSPLSCWQMPVKVVGASAGCAFAAPGAAPAGNQLRSAMILGINRSTLKKRLLEMREAGIKVFT